MKYLILPLALFVLGLSPMTAQEIETVSLQFKIKLNDDEEPQTISIPNFVFGGSGDFPLRLAEQSLICYFHFDRDSVIGLSGKFQDESSTDKSREIFDITFKFEYGKEITVIESRELTILFQADIVEKSDPTKQKLSKSGTEPKKIELSDEELNLLEYSFEIDTVGNINGVIYNPTEFWLERCHLKITYPRGDKTHSRIYLTSCNVGSLSEVAMRCDTKLTLPKGSEPKIEIVRAFLR